MLARIGNLELVSRAVVDGFINGLHKAPYFGASVDFAEHRGYVPGDDIRRMDWRLWARTDRYYIKEYEAESNMNFSVLLDVSKSMDYGSRGITKFDYARILTACLTNLVHHQRDRVGFVAFDTEVVEHVPPSAKHMETVLHVLDRLKPGRPGNLKEPLHKLAEHFGRRGVLVLISDFYDEPEAMLDAVSPLRFRGNDLIVFHVLDPTELEFGFSRRAAVRGSGERRADAGGAGGVPRGIPVAGAGAHRRAAAGVFGGARRLHAARHVETARLRAVQVPERAIEDDEVQVRENPSAVPSPAVLRRPGRTGDSRAAAPDAAREEADHPLSVADVRAADPVSVGAAAEDPALAAAARPRGGAGADHPGVRAAVHPPVEHADACPARARARWWCCSTPATAWASRDRWERARAAANAAINRMSGSDRGSVVLLLVGRGDRGARVDRSASQLTAAVAAAKPGAGATRYAPALKVAGSILAESTLPRREVVLISDFQRNGWRGEEGIRLPQGTVLTPVPITGVERSGRTSASPACRWRARRSPNQERVAVTAGLIEPIAARPSTGATLTLEVNGIKHGAEAGAAGAGRLGKVEFEPVTRRRPQHEGHGHVVARRAGRGQHLQLRRLADRAGARHRRRPRQRRGPCIWPRAGGWRGAAVRDGHADSRTTLSDEDLRRSAVIVLNDVVVPPSLARRLQRYVEQGGGLFVAAGQRANWPADVDVLPGQIESAVDRTRGDAARVGALEYAHPVFEPFRAPRSGNFSSGAASTGTARSRRRKDAQVLAKFDGTAPAVLERRVGSGRVLLWASALDTSWSDLPRAGVFVPFVHQSMRYLAAYTEPQAMAERGPGARCLDRRAEAGRGAARGADAVWQARAAPGRGLRGDGADRAGLLRAARPRQGRRSSWPATWTRPKATCTPMDPKEIAAAARWRREKRPAGGSGTPLTPEAQERSQRLWWYSLVAGLLLLGADTVMSNRLAKT